VVDVLDEMVRARLPWLPPDLRSWYTDVELVDQLTKALGTEYGRLDDVDFGAGFRNDVGLGVGVPLDWANRRIELASGGWAVTGIRFRRLDIGRPFVDVIATSEPPIPDGLAAVAEAVVPAYREFDPKCLRVEAPEPAALVAEIADDIRFGEHSGVDMRIVAGLVEQLLGGPRVPTYDLVALRPGTAEQLAGRAADIYRTAASSSPDLAWWANPEDAESLAACEAEGLLFEVVADGDPAGVVAALRYDDHGMRGFSVQEICLDDRHRGRRLAPGVMQRLLEQLPARRGDVLWGTIHPDNAASLRNALSIGRTPVGGYAWITPAGLPGMPPAAAH
jgi:L-amino acid N-acyltransferase YncA